MDATHGHTDLEWEKHRPSWGEIPTARAHHFAFVFQKKMYIMGGSTNGAPPDGTNATDISFLDLVTWEWGKQKSTGVAPRTDFLAANCSHDEESNSVIVTLGPRWEAGTSQVIEIFTLDLSTWTWTVRSPRGRWNISWKMEATYHFASLSKVFQIGRYPVSNFSDKVVSGSMLMTGNNWNTAVELTGPERDATVIASGIVNQRAFAVWADTTGTCVTTASFFDITTSPSRLVSSVRLQRTGDDAISSVIVGDVLYLFETATLCQDNVQYFMIPQLSSPSASQLQHIRNTSRAPQKPRIGASVVHYDGYLIFFGGAVSRELGAKTTNEVYVLNLGGVHKSIDDTLDLLADADAIDAAAQPTTSTKDAQIVEHSPSKAESNKKSKKKRVGFADAESSDEDQKLQSTASSSNVGSNGNDKQDKQDKQDNQDKEEEVAAPESKSAVENEAKNSESPSTDANATNNSPSPTNEPISKATTEAAVAPEALTPEERVLKFLEENQTNTPKLLQFAFNNPDCFPDMAFKVQDTIFWAHKAIVGSRSSRWRQHLDPQHPKNSSPNVRRSGDLEDSQLDVSTESAMPKDRASPSPFMFGKLGSSAIDLMLDEEDKTTKFEMLPLPPRYSNVDTHPLLSIPKPPPMPNAPSDKSSIPISTVTMPTKPTADAIQPAASSSGIAPPSKSVPCYTVEDLDASAFGKVLLFMYTGEIHVSAAEADNIADVAHEFLLDEISAICRDRVTKTHRESPVKQARLLRKLVGSPFGSDYFFVVRQKKLFAHRFAIFLFSTHFRKLMLSRADKAYMEVRDLEAINAPVEVFIDFCRMMYCNFTSRPEHAEKKLDVSRLTELSTKWEEYRCLSLVRSSKVEAQSTLELYRVGKRNSLLLRDARRWILTHFGKFAQDARVMKQLTKQEQAEWLSLADSGGASWLDKLWFAHAVSNTDLLSECVAHLTTLINVENVVPVLFCAHHVGAKGLRSDCMDFMSAHSISVEDTRRMQIDAPVALGKVAGLSASLNAELTTKLTHAASSASKEHQKVKSCALCTKQFSTFGKKHNCALCHKIACSDCTKRKVSIPPVFGFTKPRDICITCAQLVDIWADPASKPSAK